MINKDYYSIFLKEDFFLEEYHCDQHIIQEADRYQNKPGTLVIGKINTKINASYLFNQKINLDKQQL